MTEDKKQSKKQYEEMYERYMNSISHAAMRHCIPEDGLYHGKDGCHRFARECGAAYVDFDGMGLDVPQLMSATYSGICVIAYGLKPPVDAHTWLEWLREGYENAKKTLEDSDEGSGGV